MKKFFTIAATLCALCACGDSNDDTKDMSYPEILSEGITANPVDCQEYHRGDVLPVRFILKDDTELGAYNIEIHGNFDHHTHSTSSVDCEHHEHDGHTEASGQPWVYNQDFTIPEGLTSYEVSHDIAIPQDIAPGDYHFMLRVTDRAGWQQMHAVAISIEE